MKSKMKHNVSRDCLVFIFFNFLIRIILAIRFNDINMRFSVSENRSYEVLNVLTRTFLIRKSHSRHFLGHAKKKNDVSFVFCCIEITHNTLVQYGWITFNLVNVSHPSLSIYTYVYFVHIVSFF